jgi:3-oxoacyl-[acyl-carrier protein] reductase
MGDTLKGKVAVVTGSGQGIGRAIAVGIGSEGAKVITNNRKPGSTNFALLKEEQLSALSPERRKWAEDLSKEYSGDAETTAEKIRQLGGEATAFFGDVSDFETAEKLIKTAVDTYGTIDILVNVAGGFGFSPIWEMTEELWDRVTNIKPKSYFNTIRHAAPYMMEKKWGRIINCTSQSWAGDTLFHAEYAAANAGAVGLTRAVAWELLPYGITCNAFSPFARTRASFELSAYTMAQAGAEDEEADERAMAMLERTPSPDDLAPMIVYLAYDLAAEISGSVFLVGGSGVSMHHDPVISRSINKADGRWTIEELKVQVPRVLLAGYKSPAIRGRRE